jgi:hypothetical protein
MKINCNLCVENKLNFHKFIIKSLKPVKDKPGLQTSLTQQGLHSQH